MSGANAGKALAWTALCILTVASALLFRPPLPMDETRYLAVAWEMWRDGDFIVPNLNDAPYDHKPPLLFWLMQAGWAVFGVVEWWPRLVAPLFGLASLFLTYLLARRLWPDRPAIAGNAPLFLLGGVFWGLFGTLTMFDMMLAALTLLYLVGAVDRLGGRRSGLVLMILAGGLGLLAKGPAFLLHILPAAFAAPLWAPARPEAGWGSWYRSVLIALAGGAAMVLAWAGPAAVLGGEEYRNAIFWGQTAGRVVNASDHARAWWWYFAVLPPMLLPWLIWPPLWRAVRALPAIKGDAGIKLIALWVLPAFIVFSIVSGKQLHYLLPELPALALLFAALLARRETEIGAEALAGRLPNLIPGALFALVSLAAAAAPLLGGLVKLPPFLTGIEPLAPLAVAVVAIAVTFVRRASPLVPAVLVAVLVAGLHAGAAPVLKESFDLRPLAAKVRQWQDDGRPVANYAKYHGQYHFLGRLEKPIALVGDMEIRNWVEANPNGVVVTYIRNLPEGATPIYAQPFRSHKKKVAVWEAASFVDNWDLVRD